MGKPSADSAPGAGPGPAPAERALAPTRRPRLSPRAWRIIAFWVLMALYVVVTLMVIYKSPLIRLDGYLAGSNLGVKREGFGRVVETYVIFGQRGPATLSFLPVFLWMAWTTRSSRPLVMLVTALVVLNVSVGVAKLGIGRIGPAHSFDSHLLFAHGGDIYPSGHVSNAVVLYGLLPMIVPQYRKALTVFAIWVALSVGLGTVYIRTHWFSDVISGWIAGGLVLLAMPTCMPIAQEAFDNLCRWIRQARTRRQGGRAGGRHASPAASAPGGYARPSGGYPSGYALSVRDGGHPVPASPTAGSHRFTTRTRSLDAHEQPTRGGG